MEEVLDRRANTEATIGSFIAFTKFVPMHERAEITLSIFDDDEDPIGDFIFQISMTEKETIDSMVAVALRQMRDKCLQWALELDRTADCYDLK